MSIRKFTIYWLNVETSSLARAKTKRVSRKSGIKYLRSGKRNSTKFEKSIKAMKIST